jgi:hypothetical protein
MHMSKRSGVNSNSMCLLYLLTSVESCVLWKM